jgi:hypothetical protein
MGSEQSSPKCSKEEDKEINILSILNVSKDIPDYRDIFYEIKDTDELRDSRELGSSIDLRSSLDCCEVLNVYDSGMGISANISTIIYNELKKKGEELFLPSLNFIFYNSLLTEYNSNDFSNIDNIRLSIRNSLKSINKYGICKDIMLPFNKNLKVPNEECYNYGKNYNIKYLRVKNDLGNIKFILSNNQLILCNLTIYTSFLKDKVNNTGIIDFPNDYDSPLGMFSCIIVGYNETQIILKLSLGDNIGDKGYFYINYEYLKLLCGDLWIIDIYINKKNKLGLNFDVKKDILKLNKNKPKHDSLGNQNENKKDIMFRGSIF